MIVPRTITLEMHPLVDEAVWGQWCPHCALPSAAKVTVLGVRPDNLRVIMRIDGTWCTECGRKVNDDGGN